MNSLLEKSVFTCGPASEDAELLAKIAGSAGGLRLNIAHLTPDALKGWLDRLIGLRVAIGRQFRIVLDLQGAKVRVGHVPAVKALPEQVELFFGEKSEQAGSIPVPNRSVFAMTSPGDRLLLNDRRIVIAITGKSEDRLQGKVEQNGPLSSGKGINSPDRVFELARVMPSDALAVEMSRHIENLDYAVSFVADGREKLLFRPLTGPDHRLIAKIEQRAAFDHLDAIAAGFDELWLCRGDLGAEVGLKSLGIMQRRFIDAMPELQRPCLLAGEVLGSMVVMAQPSRAEIVQLYDAMRDGFAGFVLSDETACGAQIPAVLSFVNDFFADRHV